MSVSRRRVGALVLVGALATGGAVAALAAERPFEGGGPRGAWSALGRPSPEDRAAFTDARVAALHAGLKLSADQERLWPPVEGAIRDLAGVWQAQRQARRERGSGLMGEDAPAALRAMAEAQGARADALRKLADAAQPLYATLDAGQKRRAMVLARPMGPGFGPHHGRGPHGGPGGQRGPGDD